MLIRKAPGRGGFVNVSLVILGIASAVLAIASIADAAATICVTFSHGQYINNSVPCNNASCVDVQGFQFNNSTPCPNTSPPNCTDGATPDTFTATTAANWYNCQIVTVKTYPSCVDSCATCANVFFYRGYTCSAAARCTATGTISGCLTSSGQKG